MDPIPEDECQELRVTFLPELHLQRRIWILNILRKEAITCVLDVGCGEGQLLVPLSQPAPWLSPPPATVLPPRVTELASPTYNDDEIPNLHISHLYGVDICETDLEFAKRETAPPQIPVQGDQFFYSLQQRWEELEVKLWKGGLEVFNEEFVGIECIVSTEVIEHLSPKIFPAFAPMLLGVYHPKFLLITTPSYTYNARFTPPNAPKSARRGYPDPTERTDRIFRHDDHKFEWTTEEFKMWCESVAEEWGYGVEISGVGRAVETDLWGRDEELGEATSVACFKKAESKQDTERARRGQNVLADLHLTNQPHELFANHIHRPHPDSRKPIPLQGIATMAVQKMDQFQEAFMRVEELWFEPEVAAACGGWIELLVRAIEECEDLSLLKEDDMRNSRGRWRAQRLGAMARVADSQPREGESSLDYIPPDWIPSEAPYDNEDGSEFEESVAAEGDVSWNNSELDTEDEGNYDWSNAFLQLKETTKWGGGNSGDEAETSKGENLPSKRNIMSAASSTAGWDGDASEDTS